MKKRHNIVKFAIVAALIGFFSPSVDTNTATTAPSKSSTYTPVHLDFSLLNKAEARPVHRQARRVSRRTSRRTSRRVNYRHNTARYYGYWGGRPIVGFAAGLAVGTVVAAATMPSTCVTTYVGGVAYRRCGSTYYRPYYQGDTVVYQVVNPPY